MSAFGDLFNVDFDSSIEWQVWAFGTYEKELGNVLATILRSGDMALDVGANIGVHAIRMAKLIGESGRVIAVEADTSVAKRLRSNIVLNRLTNVQVVNAAATEEGGKVLNLYRPPEGDSNRGRASLLGHDYLTGRTQAVKTVTLDDLVSGGRVALIKIDVEGAELGVLQGARELISAHRPVVIFEFNQLLVQADMSPLAYFQALDYEILEMKSERHVLTGRTKLNLRPVGSPPAGNVNILARPR